MCPLIHLEPWKQYLDALFMAENNSRIEYAYRNGCTLGKLCTKYTVLSSNAHCETLKANTLVRIAREYT